MTGNKILHSSISKQESGKMKGNGGSRSKEESLENDGVLPH